MGIQKRRRRKAKTEQGNIQQPKRANRDKHTPKRPHISATIDKMWDPKKTLKENYAAAGLAYDPNEVVNSTTQNLVAKGILPDPEVADLEEIIEHEIPVARGTKKLIEKLDVPEAAPPKEKYLGVRERHYWKALYKKYGSNYGAMERDMKLNNKQYTKKQCEKKIALLLEKYTEFLNSDS
eukprot:TRINITY_DN12752_c0_g1_i1.p1 TRINITY_DN12752_c0_g1~~TRINITY_DN12752_c0_g1_i1.p1  ORF type:complete len:191 (+),score=48.62 TRINITY_DN12752_c0_g1_i1:34-573(+)